MHTDSIQRTFDALCKISLALLGAALISFAILSLQWRFQHDTALLFYISFLVEHFGSIPYRDVFDVNLPITYLVYGLIGRLTDYSDLGVRIADLVMLGGLQFMTWRWMRETGIYAAWAGTLVFGLIYLKLGPAVSLQREFLILLPLMGALLAFSRSNRAGPPWRMGLTGLLLGIACLIKPQAAIALPVLLLLEFIDRTNDLRNVFVRAVAPSLVGFLFPLLTFFVLLISFNGFDSFRSIVSDYYPLYAQLNGEHIVIQNHARWTYLMGAYVKFGGFGWWLIPCGVVTLVSLRTGSARNPRILLLAALTFGYSLYPLFPGKFWHYHWLLFVFFAIQLASLSLEVWSVRPVIRMVAAGLFLVFAFSAAAPSTLMLDQIRRGEPFPIKGGRVDEIAAFLQTQLRPGETVQPLDWTGGSAHALLLARARTATRFVYDVVMYHHVSHDFIRDLRREFLFQMDRTKPRFVIEVYGEDKQWAKGEDTTREFPELSALLRGSYGTVKEGNGYRIHERKIDIR